MTKLIALVAVTLLGLGLAVPAMADGEMCGAGYSQQIVSTPQLPLPVATTAPVTRTGG